MNQITNKNVYLVKNIIVFRNSEFHWIYFFIVASFKVSIDCLIFSKFNQTLNKGKKLMVTVTTKKIKNDATIRIFPKFFVIFIKNVSIKSFFDV